MAVSATCLSAVSACSAAPVPRPPQPIRPTFNLSEPAAWATEARSSAVAVAATAAVPCIRNVRRLGFGLRIARGLRGPGGRGAGGRAETRAYHLRLRPSTRRTPGSWPSSGAERSQFLSPGRHGTSPCIARSPGISRRSATRVPARRPKPIPVTPGWPGQSPRAPGGEAGCPRGTRTRPRPPDPRADRSRSPAASEANPPQAIQDLRLARFRRGATWALSGPGPGHERTRGPARNEPKSPAPSEPRTYAFRSQRCGPHAGRGQRPARSGARAGRRRPPLLPTCQRTME